MKWCEGKILAAFKNQLYEVSQETESEAGLGFRHALMAFLPLNVPQWQHFSVFEWVLLPKKEKKEKKDTSRLLESTFFCK